MCFSNSYKLFDTSGSYEDLLNKYGVKERDLVDESRFVQKVEYDNP